MSSKFTQSQVFSASIEFSQTKNFTSSSEFTSSDLFTQSQMFSSTDEFVIFKPQSSNLLYQSYSLSLSLTFIKRRSVTKSASNSMSISYSMSYDTILGTYTLVMVEVESKYFLPYIIYFLSPSYLSTSILMSIQRKKNITKEQLIGITCGSVTIFFLILYIVISIKHHANSIIEFSTSSFLSSENEEQDQVETVTNNNTTISLNGPDIDNWL